MSHTGLSGLFGQSMSSGMGQSMSSGMGQNMLGALGSASFQQQAAQQYNAAMAQQQARYNANRQTYDWVWNGRPVSITEFAELAYGDTPQGTMFLLKYSEKGK